MTPISPAARDALQHWLEGQKALKGRVDGRYSRFVGLFAAAVVGQVLVHLTALAGLWLEFGNPS